MLPPEEARRLTSAEIYSDIAPALEHTSLSGLRSDSTETYSCTRRHRRQPCGAFACGVGWLKAYDDLSNLPVTGTIMDSCQDGNLALYLLQDISPVPSTVVRHVSLGYSKPVRKEGSCQAINQSVVLEQ